MRERIHGVIVLRLQTAARLVDLAVFKTRYATFGFSDKANLDEGAMWPTAFALKEWTSRQRGKDRRASEESGELRTELH